MVIGAGSTVDEASQRIGVSEQYGADGPGEAIDGSGPKTRSEQGHANTVPCQQWRRTHTC